MLRGALHAARIAEARDVADAMELFEFEQTTDQRMREAFLAGLGSRVFGLPLEDGPRTAQSVTSAPRVVQGEGT